MTELMMSSKTSAADGSEEQLSILAGTARTIVSHCSRSRIPRFELNTRRDKVPGLVVVGASRHASDTCGSRASVQQAFYRQKLHATKFETFEDTAHDSYLGRYAVLIWLFGPGRPGLFSDSRHNSKVLGCSRSIDPIASQK